MPVTTTLDIRLVERVIGFWVEDRLGMMSYWEHQNIPRPGRPYCSLSFPVGVWAQWADYRNRPRISIKSKMFTVIGPVAEGLSYGVKINGFVFSYVAQLGDDENSVRDQLVQMINDGEKPVISTALGGQGEYSIESTADGLITQAEALYQTSSEQTLEEVVVSETGGVREIRVSIELHSLKKPGLRRLEEYQNILVSDLGREETQYYFRSHGLVVVDQISPGIDLSAIEGSEVESRIRFELRFTTSARIIESPHVIESIEGQVDIGGIHLNLESPSP